jgi:hypothetical protein|uniref:Uncharacterized protein n=1 Tax=uncultured marine crenarchaeote HF4000_APKG2O16 TaxID=455582 RepID=B3T701_9ARCH|nr:hypothetical protein ALOHA_HF4000APKG2O16ctg10g6 [uncultured marine crenarchaeote HF4000_APKG2O16]
MSDKSEICPVCKNKLNEHRVQDFIDCIQKLFEKNKGNRRIFRQTEINPTKIILTGNAKNQEALSVITDLVKNSRSILTECDKDPNLNKLAIQYLLVQKQLLEKLREILV